MSKYYAVDARKWSYRKKVEWLESIGVSVDNHMPKGIINAEILYYEGPGDWSHSSYFYYSNNHTEHYPLRNVTNESNPVDSLPEELVVNGITYRRVH